MTEREYQRALCKRIKQRLPDAIILKNDSSYMQGIPDLLILHKERWAALEVKVDENAEHQANQDHYIDKMDNWSYAAFIYPQNEKEILDGMERSLKA